MTNETIERVIDCINSGSEQGRIFARPLIGNVQIADVWTPDMPDGKCGLEKGYRFYLIFSKAGGCVGAVFDMGSHDLHAFTKPEFRRRGFMSHALREIILPHLLREERAEQKVTFENDEARALLEKTGFRIVGEGRAVISAKECARVKFPESTRLPFPEGRMKAMKTRVRQAAGLLQMVQEEAGLYPELDFSEKTSWLVQKTMSLAEMIEDDWWSLPVNLRTGSAKKSESLT